MAVLLVSYRTLAGQRSTAFEPNSPAGIVFYGSKRAKVLGMDTDPMDPSAGCRAPPARGAEACSSAAVDTANTRARGGRAASRARAPVAGKGQNFVGGRIMQPTGTVHCWKRETLRIPTMYRTPAAEIIPPSFCHITSFHGTSHLPSGSGNDCMHDCSHWVNHHSECPKIYS